MNKILEKAVNTIELEILGLNKLKTMLNSNFIDLVESCREALDEGGKIVITGIGKSGHIGHKISATLASTGSPSAFLHPVEAMHGDLGIIQKNDILIAISYSGETEEVISILPAARRLGIKIGAITGNVNSKLAKWADIVVSVKVEKEACPFNLAPTTSTTAQLVMGDALAMVLLDIRGFTKEDFGRLHPGGAIGRAITLKVADIMRSEDSHRLVKVRKHTSIKDTILAMTEAKSGSAIITDSEEKLIGIFTDGDFRKYSNNDPNILTKQVEEYMTKTPISVNSSDMAVTVLNIIEKRHVDDIIVIDDNNKVVGIVDSQDLPGFKLM